MQNLLILFFIIVITFIPILLWGYIFISFGNNKLNRKRFLAGIIGGIISVIPILYLDKFIDKLHLGFLNVFYYITNIGNNIFSFLLSLIFIIIFILILSLTAGFIFNSLKKGFKIFIKNLGVFIIFSIIISIIVYFFNYFSFFNKSFSSSEISFGKISFNSIKLMIYYYILVGILEEVSKHFNFLQTSYFYIKNIKDGILYSVFVALGFSFIENILYFYNIYQNLGFSNELITTYFLRSIFSVFVHIFASFIVGYYFSKAYLDFEKKGNNFGYLKIFLFGIFFGILVHSIFDISLSLGFISIIFLYFIIGYFYMGSILLKKE